MDKEKSEIKYFLFLKKMYTNHALLPNIDMFNREWQSFFDVIYKYTNLKKKTNFYFGYLYIITIEVLNNAYIKKEDRITLCNFIEKIDILNYFDFSYEDIIKMKEEIFKKSSFGKILYFTNGKNRA